MNVSFLDLKVKDKKFRKKILKNKQNISKWKNFKWN